MYHHSMAQTVIKDQTVVLTGASSNVRRNALNRFSSDSPVSPALGNLMQTTFKWFKTGMGEPGKRML